MKLKPACVCAIFLCVILITASMLHAQETIFLPGGPVYVQSFPANSNLEEGDLFVVRLADDTSRWRVVLAHAGISLHMQIAPNLWWATAEHGGTLPASVPVNLIYKPRPSDKIIGVLSQRLNNSSEEQKIILRVSFLPGTSASTAEKIVESFKGEVEGQLLLGSSMEVRINSGLVAALAASNQIVAIEPGGRQRHSLNKRAAKLSGADVARNSFGLTGSGIVAGIWDGDPVYLHNEFGNRLIIAESGKSDSHATHVAGTIGASGLKAKARGFAPEVTIVSYNFNGDIPREISSALNRYGVTLANNSWGLANGWEWEGEWVWYGNDYFGKYSADARAFDEMITETGIIATFAAGNDREDRGAGKGRYYDWEERRYKTNSFHPADGPYDTIGEVASAKNVITVGAVKDTGPMTSYSSWGPVDDGRIKPEVVANGHSLYSTVLRNRYGKSSGTSMATPAVTGGLALVSEMWQRTFGEQLRADMARALLAATATDEGRPGPDYSYGFGILDVASMVELVSAGANAGTSRYDSLSPNNRKQSFSLVVPGDAEKLRVAIAWLDPAAAPFAETTLVNDLDLALTAPDGTVYFPWKLDPTTPTANATRGINRVDNIELVEINHPMPGEWKVSVTAASLGSSSSQTFAIVVYGSTKLTTK